MIHSIRDIDRFLGDQVQPHQFRRVRELAWMADALEGLHRYRAERWRYAADQARETRAGLEAQRDRLEAAQQDTLHEIRGDYEALGVQFAGRTLEAAQQAWVQISDLVARHIRDQEALGSVGQVREREEAMMQQGMVAIPGAHTDPLIERARRLRDNLARATQQAQEIARLEAQVEAVDVYEVDEHLAAIHRQLRAEGYVVIPDRPGSFPEMDPNMEASLQRLGFAPQPAGQWRQ